jgi:DNA-binding GntR family transcriptional regulator
MRNPSPYDVLRDAIVSGELGPDEPLVEARLAKRIGVSRTPVREALRRLEQEGLVQRVDRSLHVRGRSPDEILEIYNVRILLESEAARAAAERATPGDLSRIRVALRRMRDADAGSSPSHMAELNASFHNAIWHASHDDTLLDLLERLRVRLHRYQFTTYLRQTRWEPALEEHTRLLEAIVGRDGEAAARIAAQHLVEARDLRLELLEETMEHGVG